MDNLIMKITLLVLIGVVLVKLANIVLILSRY